MRRVLMNLDIIPSIIVEKRGVAGDIASSLRVQILPLQSMFSIFHGYLELWFL